MMTMKSFSMRQRTYLRNEMIHFCSFVGEGYNSIRIDLPKYYIEEAFLHYIPDIKLKSYAVDKIELSCDFKNRDESVELEYTSVLDFLDFIQREFVKNQPDEMYENGIRTNHTVHLSGVYDFINKVFIPDKAGQHMIHFIKWGSYINAFYISEPTWFQATHFEKDDPHSSKEIFITNGAYSPGEIVTQTYAEPMHPNANEDLMKMTDEEYRQKYGPNGYGWKR